MDLYTIARKQGTGAIIWSEDQKQYIKQEYVDKDRTLKSLASEFNVQPQAIRNLLRKMNVEIINKKIRNYPRNSNYFTNIDSSEKAYWLGFMYADGTVSSKTNTIALGLKDQEHVEKFKQAIGAYNNKISVVTDNRFSQPCIMYDFSIRDSQLHDDLIAWGCVSNKNYVEELRMPNINSEYIWDFLRGFFDGDGCITWSKNNNRYTISWTGNKYFLQDIRKLCQKDKVSIEQNVKSKITYQFRLSGQQDVLRILTNMYKNATIDTVLERKLIIVNSCLSSLGASPLNL